VGGGGLGTKRRGGGRDQGHLLGNELAVQLGPFLYIKLF